MKKAFLFSILLICCIALLVACGNVDTEVVNDAVTIANLKTDVGHAFDNLSIASELAIDSERGVISFTVENEVDEIDISDIKLSSGSFSISNAEGSKIDTLELDEGENVFSFNAINGNISVNYTLKITRAAKIHRHKYGSWTIVTEATCSAEGLKKKVCECGDEVTEVIPKKDHTYGNWEIIKDVTCTEDGSKKKVCSVCGDIVTEVITSNGHDYGDWETVSEATTENDGLEKKTCSKCGDVITKVVPKHVHNLAHHIAQAPTCTSVGWEAYDTCSLCGYTTYSEISARGHDYVGAITAPTCTVDGYTTYTCSRCSDSYISDRTDATGHTEVVDNAVAATCMESGLTEGKHCSVCHSILLAQTIVPAIGHTYGDLVVLTPATCTADGEGRKECSSCGNIITERLSATGHTWDSFNEFESALESESQGLSFELNGTKDGYLVSGRGTCNDSTIVIPLYYEALPVVAIKPNAFKNQTGISTIFINKNVTSIGDEAFYRCLDLKTVWIGNPNEVSIGNDLFGYVWDDTSFRIHVVESMIDYYNGVNARYWQQYVVQANRLATWEKRDYTVVKAATCTETGSYTKTCVDCGFVTGGTIPALGHMVVVDPAVEPTYERTGLTEGCHCSRCGLTLVKREVVAVKKDVEDLLLNRSTLYLEVGSSFTLTTIPVPRNATASITWVSKNSTIASVSNGVVTGLAVGKTDIIASGGDYQASCEITVGLSKTGSDIVENYELNFTKNITQDAYIVTSFTGTAKHVDIPDKHLGLRVIAIGSGAFKNNQYLESVSLKNSIESIQSQAFYGCTKLETINFPTTLKEIGSSAFENCYKLKSISIPAAVINVSDSAFERCLSLSSVSIANGVKTIGNNTFERCASLKSIVLPNSITSIGSWAFNHAESLETITLSTGMDEIAVAAFSGCYALTSIELPANIKKIGNSAFSDCTNLASLRILGNITSLGNSAFYKCVYLTSIYWGSKVSGNCAEDNFIFYNGGINGTGIVVTVASGGILPSKIFEPVNEHQNPPYIIKILKEDGSVFSCTDYLPYIITGITFDDQTLVWNNTNRSISVSNLPVGATVTYENNGRKDIGTQTVTAYVSIGYAVQVFQASLTIEKASYDMSRVTFADKEFTYDGADHSLSATRIPSGVSVSYLNNAKNEPGEYVVTAVFSGDTEHYQSIPNLSAKLTIKKKEITVQFDGATGIKYDGKEHKEMVAVAVGVINSEVVPVVLSYSGEMIEAGTYTVTASIDHPHYLLTKNNTTTVTITRSSHTVTFKQKGYSDVVKTVLDLGQFTDYPVPKDVDGFIVIWEDIDLTSVTENMIVNAIFTPISYDITYTLDEYTNGLDLPDSYTVEDEDVVLPIPQRDYYTFSWKITYENDDSGTEGLAYSFNSSTNTYSVTGRGSSTSSTIIIPRTYNGYPVTSISENAFNNQSGIEKVIVFDNIKAIGKQSFFRCSNLKTVIIVSSEVISIGDDLFGYVWDKVAGFMVYVPANQVSGYRNVTAAYWQQYLVSTNQIAAWTEDMIPKMDYYTSTISTSKAGEVSVQAIWTPIKYDISYELNGGVNNENNPVSYTVESSITSLLSPSKSLYEFKGWYADDEFANVITEISVGSHGDICLFAKWQPIAFNITYDVDEYVSTIGLPVSYTVEDLTIALPTFSRDYYTFAWMIDGVKVTSINTSSGRDLIVTAVWTPVNFDITYDLAGGTNNQNNPSNYTVESEIVLLAPTKEGYDFVGWIGSNGEIAELEVIVEKGSHEPLSYAATWALATYSITYELYNGENHIKNPFAYTIEDDIELKPATKTGYTFKGWYLEDAFATQLLSITSRAGNLLLYAKFEANSYKATFVDDEKRFCDDSNIMTVTFDANNGTSPTTKQIVAGETLNPYSIMPTKSGCLFDGWYYNSSKVIGSVAIQDNATFYARWIEKNNTYTVTGSGYVDHPSRSETFTFVAPTNSKKLHIYWTLYGYISWSGASYSQKSTTGTCTVNGVKVVNTSCTAYRTTASSGSKSAKSTSYTDVSCKAGDVITICVSGYDGWVGAQISEYDSATVSISETIRTKTYLYDESMIDNVPSIKKSGYSLLGWENEDNVLLSEIWSFTSNQTFRPHWTPIEYPISYSLDGGTNNEENPSSYTIESSVTLLDPEKRGYSFVGWYTDADYTNSITTIKNRIGEISLFALFTINDYELNLDGQGGVFSPKVVFYSNESIAKEEYLEGDESIVAYYPPTPEGYVFAGWYLDPEFETIFNFDATVLDDLTLYAKLIPISYNVIKVENTTTPITVTISGQTEKYYAFIPMSNGEITISSNSALDTCGILYDSGFVQLLKVDDISDTDLNFSITYNVVAGTLYYIAIKGTTASSNGTAEISVNWQGNCSISGTTFEDRIKRITYSTKYILPDNVVKEGYRFIGWFDEDGTQYTSGIWEYTSDVHLYARFEALE